MNPTDNTTRSPVKQHWLDERGRPASAEQVFRAAQFIDGRGPGRFLSSGSEIDSWKRKYRGRR